MRSVSALLRPSAWGTLGTLALLAFPQQINAAPVARPNVVLMLADDLGYGDLGCYGQRRIPTPNIDRLATEGMRFTQFYAGTAVCAPSRSVLMTGLHTGHTPIRGNAKVDLKAEDLTVAEVLKTAGYTTGMIGKWGLGQVGTSGSPVRQGFDHFFGYADQTHAHNYYPTFLVRNEERVPLRNVVPDEGPYGQGIATKRVDYSDDLLMSEALGFIEQHARDPFFLYLPFTLPHGNSESEDNAFEVPDLGAFAKKDWPHPAKGYAAMVARLDEDVGRIMAKLHELGLDENTLVIFASDNGPERVGGLDPAFFGSSGGLRGIKRDLYEGGIRVPMIARWPKRIAAGAESQHVGYFGDFMATLAELAGVPAPSHRDSISFLPALLNRPEEQKQHAFLYWEFYEGQTSQALRMGRWKAVRLPMLTGPIQLFDLENDPAEQHDVAAQHPDVVKKIEGILTEQHVPSPFWSAPKR